MVCGKYLLSLLERNKNVKKYTIGKQTVPDILRKKAEFKSLVAKVDSTNAIFVRKTIKRSTFQELDDTQCLTGSYRKLS